MSSDSASGRSKGSRLVSAKPEIRKMKNEMNSGSTNQRLCDWAAMMLLNETFPVMSSTGIRLMPMATS
jgi:hypothetical protein